MQNIVRASKERSGLLPCARLERCEDREDREARERSRSCYVLERALEDARVETLRRRDRALGVGCTDAVSASGLGRLAELQYAAREGFAVWSCVPRWLRAAIHGSHGNDASHDVDAFTTRYRCGDATVTTRDRGVDVVGIRDGRLVLAQVKWYREGSCVSGDADMKLILASVVQLLARQTLAEPLPGKPVREAVLEEEDAPAKAKKSKVAAADASNTDRAALAALESLPVVK